MARKNSKNRLTINKLTLLISIACILLTILAIALTKHSTVSVNSTTPSNSSYLKGVSLSTSQSVQPADEIPKIETKFLDMSYLSEEQNIIQAFVVDDLDEPIEDVISDDEVEITSPSAEFVLTESEIDLVVQLVQHEVGSDPSVFAGYDFDLIQRYMARTILNRLGMHNWNTVYEVITAPNQFCSLSELTCYSPDEPTTRCNVLSVINGEDGLPNNILYEMSWDSSTSISEAKISMQKQVGEVYGEVYFYYNWGSDSSRLLMFACQEKS